MKNSLVNTFFQSNEGNILPNKLRTYQIQKPFPKSWIRSMLFLILLKFISHTRRRSNNTLAVCRFEWISIAPRRWLGSRSFVYHRSSGVVSVAFTVTHDDGMLKDLLRWMRTEQWNVSMMVQYSNNRYLLAISGEERRTTAALASIWMTGLEELFYVDLVYR